MSRAPVVAAHADPAASCRLTAEHAGVGPVQVHGAGEPIGLRLEDVSVNAVLAPGRDVAELEVVAPLSFRVARPVHELDLRAARAIELGEGRLVVGRGTRVAWRDVASDALLASFESSLGVALEPLPAVPCSALTLASAASRYATPERSQPANARWVSFGSNAFTLQAQAEPASATRAALAPWFVRYTGPFQLLASQGDARHVRAEWEDGSRLDGWTLAPPVAGDPIWPDVDVDGGTLPGECHAVDTPSSVAAHVRAGAAVASAPDASAWATFTAPTRVDAELAHPVSGWVAITRVPGVVSDDCSPRIWVRQGDIVAGS